MRPISDAPASFVTIGRKSRSEHFTGHDNRLGEWLQELAVVDQFESWNSKMAAFTIWMWVELDHVEGMSRGNGEPHFLHGSLSPLRIAPQLGQNHLHVPSNDLAAAGPWRASG